jgi:hypothetical protein
VGPTRYRDWVVGSKRSVRTSSTAVLFETETLGRQLGLDPRIGCADHERPEKSMCVTHARRRFLRRLLPERSVEASERPREVSTPRRAVSRALLAAKYLIVNDDAPWRPSCLCAQSGGSQTWMRSRNLRSRGTPSKSAPLDTLQAERTCGACAKSEAVGRILSRIPFPSVACRLV